ncbi:MAG: ribose-5-phosphate isomerase RpiA [Chlamydiales bacterium]|nr:ribose-5-phosphate isomerase RpiA [Chlamydiales bacterium]
MKLSPHKQDEIKNAIGKKAASLIEDGMLVGLGTGSTAAFFIQHLIERCKEGLRIEAVSSSVRSQEMAQKGGIKVLDMNKVSSIDLTIDGADEIDPKNRMIKGGGGAHVREKIVACASKKMVVIVDESKLVQTLGRFGLPVEILPFGIVSTLHKLKKLGYDGRIREGFTTDNGNMIWDIHTPKEFPDPETDHHKIIETPGVVDTGFFLNIPVKVLVGYSNGTVEFR